VNSVATAQKTYKGFNACLSDITPAHIYIYIYIYIYSFGAVAGTRGLFSRSLSHIPSLFSLNTVSLGFSCAPCAVHKISHSRGSVSGSRSSRNGLRERLGGGRIAGGVPGQMNASIKRTAAGTVRVRLTPLLSGRERLEARQ
jgi:hypothetical protein